MKDHFADAVTGQRKATRLLSFYYDSYLKTNIFENCLFISQRGNGKTFLCSLIGEKLGKPCYEIHSETIRSVDQLFDEVLFRYAIPDKDVTLIFDEIHALKRSVAEFLLSILAPSSKNRNTIRYGGSSFDIDFRHFTFLSATTDAQKVILPLKDRLKVISLVDYKKEELKEIIVKGIKSNLTKDIRLGPGVLDYLAEHTRRNARSAFLLGKEVAKFCQNYKVNEFTINHSKELLSILDIFRFGLTALEVQILASIAKSRKASLTRLAAKSGLTNQAQQDLEKVLLIHDLIDIDGKRQITEEGLKYLEKYVIT